jgi:hypothetical protein
MLISSLTTVFDICARDNDSVEERRDCITIFVEFVVRSIAVLVKCGVGEIGSDSSVDILSGSTTRGNNCRCCCCKAEILLLLFL